MIKLVALLQALLKIASTLIAPEKVDSYMTTPEENKSPYYIAVTKAAFKTKEDAEKFLQFDEKLDKAIGEL